MKRRFNTASPEDVFFVISSANDRLFADAEPFFARTPENIANIKYLLEIPFASFGGEEIYKTDQEKFAAIFYFAIKDHKFENGNKRTGVILLIMLALVNGMAPGMTPRSLYESARKVAKSLSKDKDDVLGRLANYFDEHIRPLKP